MGDYDWHIASNTNRWSDHLHRIYGHGPQSFNGQVLMDATGAPQRMRGTCVDITDQVLATESEERSAGRFRAMVEEQPRRDRRLRGRGHDRPGQRARGRAARHGPDRPRPQRVPSPPRVRARRRRDGPGGRPLLLDVATVALAGDGHLCATYLRDASPRVAGETLAAQLRESQVRRRQALELNDTVIQGLTASILALQAGDDERCRRTTSAPP